MLAADSAASVIALIAVFAIFTLLNPRFLTGLNIKGIVVSGSISTITGLGMTLIIAMRALDLSVGSIMGFSAIVAAQLLAGGLPLWLVIVLGLLIGAGLGLGNGLLISPGVLCSSRTAQVSVDVGENHQRPSNRMRVVAGTRPREPFPGRAQCVFA